MFMYKLVFTLLIGLVLSLSGGASALTFKSDGSVVQSDESSSQKVNSKVTGKSQTSQELMTEVTGWPISQKVLLAKQAFEENENFQSCLLKIGFAKMDETGHPKLIGIPVGLVGTVCFSDLISGKFDAQEPILAAKTTEDSFGEAKTALMNVVDGLNDAEVNAPLQSGKIIMRCFNKKKVGSSHSYHLRYFTNQSLFIAVRDLDWYRNKTDSVLLFWGSLDATKSPKPPHIKGVQITKNDKNFWDQSFKFTGNQREI